MQRSSFPFAAACLPFTYKVLRDTVFSLDEFLEHITNESVLETSFEVACNIKSSP